MKRLFMSYAREDRVRVDELARRLPTLGYTVWFDSSLRGGHQWWNEILDQIAACDGFVVIFSRHFQRSVACGRELDYALALGKSVLPVAVEPLDGIVLPRPLATLQIVDYADPSEDAVFALAGALVALPPSGPPPDPPPAPPDAPLSYLIDLRELVVQAEPLSRQDQGRVVDQLKPALRASDPQERAGAIGILEQLQTRQDLYADIYRELSALLGPGSEATPPPPPSPQPPPTSEPAAQAGQATAAGPVTAAVTAPTKGRPWGLISLAVGTVIVLLWLVGDCAASCYYDDFGNWVC
jgi:hypothetical protein